VTGGVSVFGIFNDAVWLKKAKELGQWKSGQYDPEEDHSSETPSGGGSTSIRIRELAEGEEIEQPKKKKTMPEWAEQLHPNIRYQLEAIYARSPLTLLKSTGIHFLLALINESELMMELMAHEFGGALMDSEVVTKNRFLSGIASRMRGMVILAIESLKALLRLVLLWRNGGRLLTTMAIPSREDAIALSSRPGEATEDEDGLPIPTMPVTHTRPYERFTLDQFLDVKRRVSPTTPTTRSTFGELLWILRPVIYLLLKFRYGRTWTPWMLSLVVEYFSIRLSTRPNLNDSENAEISRRRSLLLLYILRSPFFELLSQLFSPLGTMAYNAISKIPGLQTAADFLTEILTVYRTRYFYLAGSGSP
jgi:hypothetical protein